MTYPPHPGEPNPSYPSAPQGYPPPAYQPPQQPSYQPDYQGAPQPNYQAAPQPGYQAGPQPGYPAGPQPGYPAGPPGFGPPPGFPPPPKKSKVLPIVLVSVAIVAVLCIGGATAVVLFTKNTVEDATAKADRVVITEPARLGGLAKLENAELAAVVKEMEDGLISIPGASDSFAAFYGDPEKDMVAALATKALIISPRTELTASFKEFGDVADVVAAETGALGGVAECGTSTDPEAELAVCGWADEGSVGMILFYEKTAADVLAEFPKLRAEIESKN